MSFQKKVLPNGLTLITAELTSTEAVTVVVYVKAGTRHEQASQQGIAHFLEHFVFKGTKKRPSAIAISKELDGVGADYNAFTTKDHTGYYVKAEYTHIETALDVLSDMVLRPLLPAKELSKEKGVVIEEINMYADQPSSLIEELFDQHVYGSRHPLGKNILGTHTTITNLSAKHVKDFHALQYQPNNMIVGISGKLPVHAEQLVKKYFNKKSAATKRTSRKGRAYEPASRVTLQYKETNQAHFALGFKAPLTYTHKDVQRLKLVDIVFGGPMSSRLFTRVREKHGLGYYIYSHLSLYEDVSNWHVGAGVDTERFEQALTLLIKEWKKLAQGITAKELRMAKEYYKGKITLRTEDSARVAQWYARQGLFGLPHKTPVETKTAIDSFTLDEINALLQTYIQPQHLQLAVIGPYKDAEQFEKLLAAHT